jgi:hypothetical protein
MLNTTMGLDSVDFTPRMAACLKGNHVNLHLADQLNAVDAADWDQLAADAGLFMQRQWLTALHDSGCATAATGWQPLPIWWSSTASCRPGTGLAQKPFARRIRV